MTLHSHQSDQPDSYGSGSGWSRIRTIDAHTAGEPLRIVVEGIPPVAGATMLEKYRFAQEHFDTIRKSLMLEPRGRADMYGCLLTDPVTEDGNVGALFMHNGGFSMMCGHGIIGLVKVGLDCGLFSRDDNQEMVRIDTAAGRITATVQYHPDGRVGTVSFINVPSFRLYHDVDLFVDGVGNVTCDVAYGGTFYAYVDARKLPISLEPSDCPQLIDTGRRIQQAVAAHCSILHPTGCDAMNVLHGTIFYERLDSGSHSRNVCVAADGAVDRSPTGTGVSGYAAILHARGELRIGQTIEIESILATKFDVSIREEVQLSEVAAIVPVVTGTAHLTGRHEFFIDPHDPLGFGFALR